jgi:hypothetical protein
VTIRNAFSDLQEDKKRMHKKLDGWITQKHYRAAPAAAWASGGRLQGTLSRVGCGSVW